MRERLRPEYPPELLSRFGRKRDGGYVLPASIEGQTVALVSCGVAFEYSMERAIIKRTVGGGAYLYDYTSSLASIIAEKYFSLRKMKRLVKYALFRLFILNRRVRFTPKFVGVTASDTEVDIRSLGRHLKAEKEVAIRILKCDIEANEHNIFDQEIIAGTVSQFDIVVIEMHRLTTHYDQILAMLDQFQQAGFFIGHFHNNNCAPYVPEYGINICFELTLLHRRSFDPAPVLKAVTFPVADLDYPCCPKKEEVSFQFTG